MDAGPRQLRPRDGAELERRAPRSPKIEVRRRLSGPLRARLRGFRHARRASTQDRLQLRSHREPPARRGRCRSRRRLPRPRAPSFGIARPRSGARRPCRRPRRAAGRRAGGRRRARGRSVGASGDGVRRCRRPREPRPARTGAPAPLPRASCRGALRGRGAAAGRARPAPVRADRPVVRASCRRARRSAARKVLRQGGKELVRPSAVERELRGKLPEDRAERGAQPQNPRRKEVRKRRAEAAKLEHVRDVPAALHREHEPSGTAARQASQAAGRVRE